MPQPMDGILMVLQTMILPGAIMFMLIWMWMLITPPIRRAIIFRLFQQQLTLHLHLILHRILLRIQILRQTKIQEQQICFIGTTSYMMLCTNMDLPNQQVIFKQII